ncbi:biotin transporter BioY [Brevundimonas vesicularis]|uniref:biotin transporter BioY n=1 Tax=Brevundimonas vesicularis TaxID=41276 RepID=UPI0038D378DB
MSDRLSKVLGFIAAVAFMALGARLDVPMHPVPMTLQSLAVLLAGLWLGPVLGPLSVLTYLTLALLGLPILSDGASGPGPFAGATAGYVYGFVLVAALAGLASLTPWARQALPGITAMFGLHLVLLAMGSAWLSTRIGIGAALAAGFTPFLIGAAVKSALAWAIWRLLVRRGGTG